MTQLPPFQCSASVFGVAPPTLQTSLAEIAETDDRAELLAPGLLLATTLQVLPFQCSVRGWGKEPVVWLEPTAHTSPAAVAATPESPLEVPGFGLETTLQALPFQCSTKVCWTLLLVV